MSFFRPVYASNGSAYGDPTKGTGTDRDRRSYYETLSQNPTRSALYHSAYSHSGLNQVRCYCVENYRLSWIIVALDEQRESVLHRYDQSQRMSVQWVK